LWRIIIRHSLLAADHHPPLPACGGSSSATPCLRRIIIRRSLLVADHNPPLPKHQGDTTKAKFAPDFDLQYHGHCYLFFIMTTYLLNS